MMLMTGPGGEVGERAEDEDGDGEGGRGKGKGSVGEVARGQAEHPRQQAGYRFETGSVILRRRD